MAFCRAVLFQSLSSTVCAYWKTPAPPRDFLLRRSFDSGSTTMQELAKLRSRQTVDICAPRASSGSSKRLRLMRRIVYDGSLEGVVGYSVPESIGVLGSTSIAVVGNERRAPVDAGMEAEVNAEGESRLAIDVRVPRR